MLLPAAKKIHMIPLLKKALIITLGCFVFAASVNIFFVPSDLNTGGLTGIALIFNTLWNVPVGLFVFLLNIPLLLLAIKYIGIKFLAWTIYATVISSLFLDVTAPLGGLLSLDSADKLLFCIFGGVVSGAGLGIVFTQGASTGGTDIISRLTLLYFPHITLGRLMLICDIVIIALGALVSGEMEIALYSAIAIYLSSGAIDTVLYGLEKSQAAIIVSSRGEEVTQRLLTELGRGVTRLASRGGYSGCENETLICAVSTRQMSTLKEIVSSIDPNAFVIFTEVHDIMGDGFRMRY